MLIKSALLIAFISITSTSILIDTHLDLKHTASYKSTNDCCDQNIVYQSIDKLPASTSVSKTILAGKNVKPNYEEGEVIVEEGQKVIFAAGEKITLKDGFKAKSGSYFHAKIEACSESPIDYREGLVSLGSDLQICIGSSLFLNAGPGFDDYLWSDGSKGERLEVSTPATYWVEVYSGCEFGRDSIKVDFYNPPEVIIEKEQILCPENIININASYPGATYLWQDGSTNAFYHANTAGKHSVEITVNGCTLKKEIEVEIDDCPFFIPNVFTPNGDGVNDVFYIKGLDISSWSLKIFNRWGKLVYQSDAYKNDWNGKDMSTGTYYYHFYNSTTLKSLKGWVAINR